MATRLTPRRAFADRGRRPPPGRRLPGPLGRRLRPRPDARARAERLRRGHRRPPEQVMGLFRRTVPVGDQLRRRPGPRARRARARSKSPPSGATAPTSTAGAPSRSSSATPGSTPSAATSRSTGCSSTRLTGEVLDFVGGRADLDARVLRAIGDPAARFAEDKLRLLRAVRFAARFGLDDRAAHPVGPGGDGRPGPAVSAERIAQELRRMLVHPTRSRAMDLAMDTGLIAAVLPPLVRPRGCSRASRSSPRRPLGPHPAGPRPAPGRPELPAGLRGAPARRRQARDEGPRSNGRTSFHNHEQVGRRSPTGSAAT